MPSSTDIYVVGEYVYCTSNDLTFSIKIVGVVDIMSSMNMDTEDMMETMTASMGGMPMMSCMIVMPAPVTSMINGSTQQRYEMINVTAVDVHVNGIAMPKTEKPKDSKVK